MPSHEFLMKAQTAARMVRGGFHTRELIFGGFVVLSALVLAACHGNSLEPAVLSANPSDARQSFSSGAEGTGTLSITLPEVASPQPTPGTTPGFYLGRATVALTISVDGK